MNNNPFRSELPKTRFYPNHFDGITGYDPELVMDSIPITYKSLALYEMPSTIISQHPAYLTRTIIGPTKINFKQCVEVLTTGTINAVSCNLPIHCGSVVYQKISSTWYGTEVGICFGMGRKPMSLRTKLYRTQVPDGWFVLLTLDNPAPEQRKLLPVIWNQLKGYRVMSDVEINTFPSINLDTGEYITPSYRKVQGHYCVPEVVTSQCPVYSDVGSWSAVYTNDQAPRPLYNNPFYLATGAYSCWMNDTMVTNVQQQYIRCDPLMTTSNTLSTTLSGIPKTIANVLITSIETILYYVAEALVELMYYLSKITDYPTLVISFVIMVYHKYSVVDSAIISLALSLLAKVVVK